MDDCEGTLHPRARRGIELFNEGRYFEAHEELEAAWRDEPGKVRRLYQGILEAGVTYLHITRGNYRGAVKVYKRSMRWLKDWPGHCRGVDVEQLRRDLSVAIGEVERLGENGMEAFDQATLKPVRWNEVRALNTKGTKTDR
jgi:predicted metal-dependent hydrolase